MRQLNELELEALKNIISKNKVQDGVTFPSLENVRVEYFRQKEITIATVFNGNSMFAGYSKRNHTDKPNKITGEMFAFSRAIQNRPKRLEDLPTAVVGKKPAVRKSRTTAKKTVSK